MQAIVEVAPGLLVFALLIVAQIVLQDALARQAVDASRAGFAGPNLQPRLQPAQEALDLGLLLRIQVDHALGQVRQQIVDHVGLVGVDRRL